MLFYQGLESIGASRGIANPEINSGFGPGTFWRRDEIRKRKIAHLAQGPHQQGKCKSGNADCEDWSSSSRCALFLLRPRADRHYRYDINILTYGFVEGLGNSFQIGCIAQASSVPFLGAFFLSLSFHAVQVYLHCFANVLSQEMMHLKSYTIYPSDPNRLHLPQLDSASPLWNSVQGQQIFEFRFRLRARLFTRALTGMNFVDNNGVKMLRVGSSGHHWLIRVDTALMILLRHLAFSSRFADHVDEFNMPSIRIAEAFHAMNDNLFVRYAQTYAVGKICFQPLLKLSQTCSVLSTTT